MYELWAGTRPHEAGIPSNRASPRHGEIQSHEGTNRSSRAERRKVKKWVDYITYNYIKLMHLIKVIVIYNIHV
jgi:hypothetical protein